MIGIIGAMTDEVAGLISMLEAPSSEIIGGIEFNTGKLFGKDVCIAKCGVGKVFAAMCAEAMIIKYSPRLIINTGVGGAIAKGLNTTDILVATALCQHDMDTSPLGDPKGMISGINRVFFEADGRSVDILMESAGELGLNAYLGVIATGDCFVADKETKERIARDFSASVCEMEGGAIAQTAFVNNTPFVVVRAVSDNADGDSHMDFPTFLKAAVKNSQALTLELIKKY